MNKFFLILALVFGLNTTNAQNFSTHQVKAGETIEDIAKRYFITPTDIYNLNPDAKNGLKANTILIIPISKAKKPEVTVTKELQGFRRHKTKRKETLYSLAKKYDITVEDIKKYNTFLYSKPLKKRDVLQIPYFKTVEVEKEQPTNKTYSVKPKEGKWRIAYKFGITVEELEALNPDMGEVLKVGQEINVPNLDEEEEKIIDERYSYYEVLPKEGFYRLKLKLGLDKTELEALNPGLEETGLKVGMVLKIPYESTTVENPLDTTITKTNLIDSIFDFSTKRLAIMLPFRLNRVDFYASDNTKASIKNDPYLNASLDFYSGVLMAIDSLKKLGVSLKIDVYDTKRSVSEVSNIINTNNFSNVDAVIGPLTKDSFNKVASALRRYNVPVVSPIGTNIQLLDNVFQSKPSNDLLKEKIINFVKKDSLESNIIIISDSKHATVANAIKSELSQAKLIFSRKNKDNGKDKFYVRKDDIERALKLEKNIVFLETENSGFASNVSSILASLIQEENEEEKLKTVDITMVTTNYNAAFQGDDISNEHLSKLQFHYGSVTRPYNADKGNSFVKRYKSTYNITPESSAVKGFDLTMDVVLRLVSSSSLYNSAMETPLTEYVESKFAYKKKSFGGYYNETVYLLKYDNLSIVEVEQ